MERRKRDIPVVKDKRQQAQNAAMKRSESGRRRKIDPTTCERDYSEDDIEFMRAMDRYKRENRRPFPTWSEALEVLRSLGYKKVNNNGKTILSTDCGLSEQQSESGSA